MYVYIYNMCVCVYVCLRIEGERGRAGRESILDDGSSLYSAIYLRTGVFMSAANVRYWRSAAMVLPMPRANGENLKNQAPATTLKP